MSDGGTDGMRGSERSKRPFRTQVPFGAEATTETDQPAPAKPLTDEDLDEMLTFCESAGGWGALGQVLTYVPPLVAKLREARELLRAAAEHKEWCPRCQRYVRVTRPTGWGGWCAEGLDTHGATATKSVQYMARALLEVE